MHTQLTETERHKTDRIMTDRQTSGDQYIYIYIYSQKKMDTGSVINTLNINKDMMKII